MNPNVITTLSICFTVLSSLVLFTIGAKLGWFRSIKIGKDGVDFQAKEKEKEIQRQVESGNINQILDSAIHKLDDDLRDYAVMLSNKLRRSVGVELSAYINCNSTKKALSGCLRYPLYEAAKNNHFKDVLKPENLKYYVDRVIKEISEEYHEFAIDKEVSYCEVEENIKCKNIPPIEDVIEAIRLKIIDNWAIPIRKKQIETCKKKIELYIQFIPSFKQTGDEIRTRISETCIEKNKNYIKALERKPEPGEV